MASRILVVDDSETVRQQLRSILTGAGYDVDEAIDGVDAAERASAKRFDLVILDLHMPRMDGLDLVRALREMPGYGATPLFLLTSEARHGNVQQARAAGVSAWIVKPFDPARLLSGVRMVLSARIGGRKRGSSGTFPKAT